MTIYDIAKAAGVSASTISRVINNKEGVSEKKRQEIKDLLNKYHYLPDENAQNLVRQSTHTIGILVDELNSMHIMDSAARVECSIMAAGYFCFMKYIGEGPDAVKDSLIDMAKKRVEGLFLMGVRFADHDTLAEYIKSYLPDIPVVLVHQNRTINLPNVYAVGSNEKRGIENCVDRLAERGRKHLLLMIDAGRTSAQTIRSAFEQRIIYSHPEIKFDVLTDVPKSREGGSECIRRFFPDHPDIDGILCVNDTMAVGVLYTLQELGKKIPKDISLIGEDNSLICEATQPKLTSMDPMLAIDSTTSAAVLLDVLKGMNRNKSITFEMEIVERETL